MSLFEAIEKRSSVRAYTAAAVPADDIRALLRTAVRAPTAMHAEPWRFVVIQDRAALARISERAKQLIAIESMPDNIFYDAGTLIVICARGAGPFVSADCWLAAENLMLAACAMGYGTCPIGFALGALDDAEIKAWLGIPADVHPIAPIIVGVPREAVAQRPRRAPEILVWR